MSVHKKSRPKSHVQEIEQKMLTFDSIFTCVTLASIVSLSGNYGASLFHFSKM